jgi:hypothetical protein
MADGIVIWSKQPIHHEYVLENLLAAGGIFCSASDVRRRNTSSAKIEDEDTQSIEVAFWNKGHDEIHMIFHISNISRQLGGIEKWIEQSFIFSGERTTIPVLYRIAISENFNNYLAFLFAYYYLNKNRNHFVSYILHMVTWESIEKSYEEGYSENWYRE